MENRGSIYKGEDWFEIFKKIPTNQAVWINKIEKYSNPLNLSDMSKIFSHYELVCEEGYKNKIPAKYNYFLEENTHIYFTNSNDS